MKKIESRIEFKTDTKRFYLPQDLAFKEKCPSCGHDVDFLDENLYYPILNKEEDIYGVCEKCDTEVTMKVKLKLSVEYDPTSLKVFT